MKPETYDTVKEDSPFFEDLQRKGQADIATCRHMELQDMLQEMRRTGEEVIGMEEDEE